MDTKTSSYLTDRLNQITHITTIADGVTKERSFTYDADGNTAQVADDDSTSQYSYDDADRLSSIVHKNDQGVNLSKNTYVYDGYDRLRIITRYTWNVQASAWSQQSQKKFVYDGMQVIQERDGDDNVVATDIWDGNISGLESRIVYDVDTPTNPPQKFFYHYDGSGNVTAVTDETQQTVAQYEYDAYGNVTSSSGNYASENPWRFSTKYYDSGSGLYYYGYRFYSPELGRWINRDPIAESGGLNLYGFIGNGPENAFDNYGQLVVYNSPEQLTPCHGYYLGPWPYNSKQRNRVPWWGLINEANSHGHHSFPKYMGGDKNQKLTPMDPDDHIQLHRDWVDFFKKYRERTGKDMVSSRKNPGLRIRSRYSEQERLDATADFYKGAGSKYEAAAKDFFEANPKAGAVVEAEEAAPAIGVGSLMLGAIIAF